MNIVEVVFGAGFVAPLLFMFRFFYLLIILVCLVVPIAFIFKKITHVIKREPYTFKELIDSSQLYSSYEDQPIICNIFLTVVVIVLFLSNDSFCQMIGMTPIEGFKIAGSSLWQNILTPIALISLAIVWSRFAIIRHTNKHTDEIPTNKKNID